MECRVLQASEAVQAFPSSGILADNLTLHLSDLKARIGNRPGRAYSYVVRSVKFDGHASFEQHGCGPNFQGGILTLCTCKHQMRSRLSAQQWQHDVWVAGFTSRTLLHNRNWLFYLAKIQLACESHSELWRKLDSNTRNAKAAHKHFLGDIYKPKQQQGKGDRRYSPFDYMEPSHHAHRKRDNDFGWRNDINYRHALKLRQPPLLVADPKLTFLWKTPTIYFAHRHCRNYRKWPELRQLVEQIKEARQ